MDTSDIEKILNYLCQELGGEWLIAGGSLVRLAFDSSRGTEDLDLMRVKDSAQSNDASRNKLYQWLIARGLGPEWVNDAMEPFVREADGWEGQLVLLREGTKGKIYRPSLTLFVFLKLRRGTDIDIEDIKKAIPFCKEGFDPSVFKKWNHPNVKKNFARVERLLLG